MKTQALSLYDWATKNNTINLDKSRAALDTFGYFSHESAQFEASI